MWWQLGPDFNGKSEGAVISPNNSIDVQISFFKQALALSIWGLWEQSKAVFGLLTWFGLLNGAVWLASCAMWAASLTPCLIREVRRSFPSSSLAVFRAQRSIDPNE